MPCGPAATWNASPCPCREGPVDVGWGRCDVGWRSNPFTRLAPRGVFSAIITLMQMFMFSLCLGKTRDRWRFKSFDIVWSLDHENTHDSHDNVGKDLKSQLSQCPSAYCCSVIQLRHHSRRQTAAKPGSLLCLALMVPYSYEAGRNAAPRWDVGSCWVWLPPDWTACCFKRKSLWKLRKVQKVLSPGLLWSWYWHILTVPECVFSD